MQGGAEAHMQRLGDLLRPGHDLQLFTHVLCDLRQSAFLAFSFLDKITVVWEYSLLHPLAQGHYFNK